MEYGELTVDEHRRISLGSVLEAERQAYARECELKKLLAMKPTTEEDRTDLSDVLKRARADASVERAKVRALRRRTPVSNVQIRQVRENFLHAWRRSIEQEHALHADFVTAAKTDPKMKAEVAARQAHLDRLEGAHKVASGLLAAFAPKKRAASRKTTTRAERRATPKPATQRASRRSPARKRRRKT